MRVAEATGITVQTARGTGVTADVLACAGGRASLWVDATVDLRASDGVPVPPGDWCGLVLSLGGLELTGTIETQPVEVSVEVPWVLTLWTEAPVVVDETELVLEVGAPGWLTAEQVPPGEGDVRVVTPDSDVSPLLIQAITLGTGWYLDDGDGVLEAGERADGSLASTAWLPPAEYATTEEDEVDSVMVEGCNCAGGGSPAAGLAGLGCALIAMRRRPRATTG
jgi:hypothetical protein